MLEMPGIHNLETQLGIRIIPFIPGELPPGVLLVPLTQLRGNLSNHLHKYVCRVIPPGFSADGLPHWCGMVISAYEHTVEHRENNHKAMAEKMGYRVPGGIYQAFGGTVSVWNDAVEEDHFYTLSRNLPCPFPPDDLEEGSRELSYALQISKLTGVCIV